MDTVQHIRDIIEAAARTARASGKDMFTAMAEAISQRVELKPFEDVISELANSTILASTVKLGVHTFTVSEIGGDLGVVYSFTPADDTATDTKDDGSTAGIPDGPKPTPEPDDETGTTATVGSVGATPDVSGKLQATDRAAGVEVTPVAPAPAFPPAGAAPEPQPAPKASDGLSFGR